MLDMEAMVSVSVEAPTVMVLGALAGDMVQLSPPLLLPTWHRVTWQVLLSVEGGTVAQHAHACSSTLAAVKLAHVSQLMPR
jgi:hypothetical protein